MTDTIPMPEDECKLPPLANSQSAAEFSISRYLIRRGFWQGKWDSGSIVRTDAFSQPCLPEGEGNVAPSPLERGGGKSGVSERCLRHMNRTCEQPCSHTHQCTYIGVNQSRYNHYPGDQERRARILPTTIFFIPSFWYESQDWVKFFQDHHLLV